MRKVILNEKTQSGFEEIYPKTSADNVDISVDGVQATNVQAAIGEINDNVKAITGGGVVTGVKGSAETTYRLGQVNITAANIGLGNVNNTSDENKPISIPQREEFDAINERFDDYIPLVQRGANGGVATLDSSGKVPTSQLPSYVDDVSEYSSRNSFPTTGESGKIYVASDTNLTYRWSGTAYVEISPSLALGTTSSTAYAGDKGAQLETEIAYIKNGPTTVKKAETAESANRVANSLNIAIFEGGSPRNEEYNGSAEISIGDEAHPIANANYADTAGSAGSAGTAGSATKLVTARAISLSGDASGSANFDGTAPANIQVTLANTGVTAGTYSVLTVDAKGRATAGGQIIAYGNQGANPPADLAVGGLWIVTRS